jgi:hypothetical protein
MYWQLLLPHDAVVYPLLNENGVDTARKTMPPPGPTSPHEYSKPELQYGLLLPPSSAGESVGDAVGLAVAPVGPGLGVTGSGAALDQSRLQTMTPRR